MLQPSNKPLTTQLIINKKPLQQHFNIERLLQQAEKQRAIFQALHADESVNHANSHIALDQSDTQLDVIAKVGSRAVSGSAGYTFGQGFTLNDRFISIGVEVSDTLGGNTAKANIQKVELERERIALQRKQAIEQVKTALSTAITNYENATMLIKSSLLRKQAEQRKFNAEMKRYREGRSDTATIVQFEGDLRTAELQAALQDIQMQLAAKQISLATGDLLKQVEAP
jgi:outer membrane protein TolC